MIAPILLLLIESLLAFGSWQVLSVYLNPHVWGCKEWGEERLKDSAFSSEVHLLWSFRNSQRQRSCWRINQGPQYLNQSFYYRLFTLAKQWFLLTSVLYVWRCAIAAFLTTGQRSICSVRVCEGHCLKRQSPKVKSNFINWAADNNLKVFQLGHCQHTLFQSEWASTGLMPLFWLSWL